MEVTMAKQSKLKRDPHDPHKEESVEGYPLIKKGKGVYACPSESNANLQYHVDIFAHRGLGGCDCWDFRTRGFPRFVSCGKLYDSFRCKHIRRVRNHILDQFITIAVMQERAAAAEQRKRS